MDERSVLEHDGDDDAHFLSRTLVFVCLCVCMIDEFIRLVGWCEADDIDDSERARLKEEGKQLKEQIALLEQQLEQTQAELQNEALQIPNDTHPDVPVGDEDSSAAVLSEFGSQPSFPFTPKDHTELSDTVGLADFDAGSRVSGTKFVYLQGYGAMLEMALINFAFTRAVQRGFAPYMTPDMVRRQVVEKCGFNPRGESSQVYNIEDHDLSMAGTAEIPLGGLHEDRIINESQLPLRMVAFGHCFRTESGASGAATRGLYRLHQFSKVELFVICTPEQSEQMHEELLKLEEDLFRNLDLHFRTIDMPTGDLGAPAYRKYDIEASMPGMGRYGEISSATNCTDFQSRRLNTRFRRQPSPGKKKGKPEYVHTLNATALAVPRTIIAIAEQKQNADGSINVPEVLQPYMGGVRVLQPPTEQGSGNRGSTKHEEETVRA